MSSNARAWSAVGSVGRSNAARSSAPAGTTRLRVRVASSARRVAKLPTRRPSGVPRRWARAAARFSGATSARSTGSVASSSRGIGRPARDQGPHASPSISTRRSERRTAWPKSAPPTTGTSGCAAIAHCSGSAPAPRGPPRVQGCVSSPSRSSQSTFTMSHRSPIFATCR
jgi:hypothetical protein